VFVQNDLSNDINRTPCHRGMASTAVASDSRCVVVVRLWGVGVQKRVTVVWA
jgi:hypothetical protein